MSDTTSLRDRFPILRGGVVHSVAMRQVPRVLLLLESSRASGRSLLRGISNYARHHGSWAFYWQPHGLEENCGTRAGRPRNGLS
jgi:hypothetical protein